MANLSVFTVNLVTILGMGIQRASVVLAPTISLDTSPLFTTVVIVGAFVVGVPLAAGVWLPGNGVRACGVLDKARRDST